MNASTTLQFPTVARSGDDGRCKTPVGNTVDLEAANWTNTIGASELLAVWKDPDFDTKEKAFYYSRIIEIPTPRWVLYDKVRLGAEIPDGVDLIHQNAPIRRLSGLTPSRNYLYPGLVT